MKAAIYSLLEESKQVAPKETLGRVVNGDDDQEMRSLLGIFLGNSPGMHALVDLVCCVANSTAEILIVGESGCGKEMIARKIHQSGSRASKPFVAINCTAISERLFEAKLFGSAKGGTLFLDEVSDMDPALQATLFRVIQEQKIRAVGEKITRDIDVRIIAATHRDLKRAVQEGRFREDLYYRLSMISIVIPPLRHRKEDIPFLADYFLKKFVATNGAKVSGFTKRAMAKLVNAHWEGNIREFENVIEQAVASAPGMLIDEDVISVTESTADVVDHPDEESAIEAEYSKE
jgi:two-component system response regulator HydG